MQRMVRYHKGITNGLIKIDAKPEIVKETQFPQLSTVMDGMGQLLGHMAMEMAIEKAKNPVLVSYPYVTPTTMVSLVTMLKWLPTKA